MTSKEILKADVLDILFENRNKQYGAYTLRKFYNRRLAFSLGLGLSIILFLLLLVDVKEEKPDSIIPSKQVTFTDVIIPPARRELPKPPRRSTPPPSTKASTQAFTDNIKLVDRDVVKPMTPYNDLINISDVDNDGPDIKLAFTPTVPQPPNNTSAKQQSEAFEAPIQREPEFPGGQKAWIEFLQNNLRSPGQLDIGEKKTVLIKFLVAVDGSVTGFEVLQSGGRMYDNEVIRVLKRMPKWKPAIQNNRPVSRSFTQPVTFVALEE